MRSPSRASSIVSVVLVLTDRRVRVLPAVLLVGLLGATSWLAASDFEPITSVDLSGQDDVASHPYGITFHPDELFAYVTLAGEPGFPADEFNGSTVVEVDLETLEITRSFTVGLFPTDARVTPDGERLVVVNSSTASLSVIDLEDGTIEEVPLEDSTGGTATFPTSLEFSPDGEELWVTTNGGDFDGSDENLIVLDAEDLAWLGSVEIVGGLARIAVGSDGLVVVPVAFPGGVFPSEPEVIIYESGPAGDWSEVATLTMDVGLDDFPLPADVVIDPDGERAYVSLFGGGAEIHVIDLEDSELLDPLATGGTDGNLQGMALTPGGAELLVLEFVGAELRVIDLATEDSIASEVTGALPTALELHGGRAWVTDQGGPTLSLFELPGSFLRGDLSDNGRLDLGDAVQLLVYLFLEGPLECADLGDHDDNGDVELADALGLLNHLFLDGDPPVYPGHYPGFDLTDDPLGDCE